MAFGPANVSNIPSDVQQWIVQNPEFAEQLGRALKGNRPFGQPNYNPMQMQQPDAYGRNVNFGQQAQQQPTQQQNFFGGLPGRVVSGPQEIKMNEIPMDGTVAFFPASDGSAIYAKCWNSNGGIDTYKFNPEKSPEEKSEKPSELSLVMERLDRIENYISGIAVPTATLEETIPCTSTGRKPKKAVTLDA